MKDNIIYLFMKRKVIFIILAVVFVSVIFAAWGPPDFYHKASTPEFCASCHVMEYEHNAWFNSMHRTIKCVDCHLPNNNFVNHAVWKGYNGAKDIIYYYGRLFDERITISPAGKSTIQKNCLKCHQGMISIIKIEDRTCWSCHRRVNHNFPMVGFL
jgi:cytochrome c nitrite reductase small subunit